MNAIAPDNLNGISIPEATTFEEWSAMGWSLKAEHNGWKWRLGDWLNFGVRKFGDKKVLAIDHGEAIGQSSGSVYRIMQVAVEFPLSQRCESLTWSHHYIACLAPREDRKAWLAKAADKGWSCQELTAAIRAEYAEEIEDRGEAKREYNLVAQTTDLERWAKAQNVTTWPPERRQAVKRQFAWIVEWVKKL